jgi:cation:H+ antiporter
VEGASSLAKRLGVSDLAVGLTVVAFGTSMPELVVNIMSSVSGASDIAIGNVVGSNIANILLILGISSVLAKITIKTSTVWTEIPLALLASVVLLVMANDHIIDGYAVSELGRSDGMLFLSFFIIFLWYIAKMAKRDDAGDVADHIVPKTVIVSAGLVLLGLALLVLGGKIVVDSAVSIALALGVSEALIGFTIVAVGTSLPELATSVVAARRGKADIAVGNIVGSNIFNIFWILGVSALIRPLPFNASMNVDLLVAVLATIVLFFAVHRGHIHQRLLFWRQRTSHIMERPDGIVMLILYAGYIGYLVWRG